MIRRVGPVPDRNQRYILRPGVYAILPIDGQVLLTVQMEEVPDIQLPGGGIDPGEHPLHALHREVMEETGWRISQPRKLGAFRRFVYMPEYDLWAEKICHVYVARPSYRVSAPVEANHETLLLSPRDARDMLGNDGDRHFVARYFSSVSP